MRDAETNDLIDRLNAQLERAREDASANDQSARIAELEEENKQLREMLDAQRNTIKKLQGRN